MRERPPDVEGTNELHQYLSAVRLHKWLILFIATLVLGVVMVRSYLETPVYQSEAKVLVRATTLHNRGLLNIHTEAELVSSQAVAEVAEKKLDHEGDPSDLLTGLTVSVSAQTEILVITYSSPDPQVAQHRAQAFATGYLDHRADRIRRDLASISGRLQAQIDRLNSSITSLTEQIRAETRRSRRIQFQTQVNTYISQLAILEQQRGQLATPTEVELGELAQAATLPTEPFSPNYTQNAVLGLFLGLVLGLFAALLRERLDDRLRGRDDFVAHLARPVLATIPRVPTWRKAKQPLLVTLKEPHSVAAEAYKTLRTSTLFVASSRGAKMLLVTSPHAGEGKSASLANLGVSLAHADRRVVLVSTDLRRPRLTDFFGLGNDGGITSVLSGTLELNDALQRVGVSRLRLLASGPIPSNPAEVLGSEAMGVLLDELRDIADIVLLDSPPVLAVADALILGPMTDGVIFVVDPSRSSRRSVANAARHLEQVNAEIIGGVLNNFEVVGDSSYKYGYASPYAPGSTRWGRQRSTRTGLRRRFGS